MCTEICKQYYQTLICFYNIKYLVLLFYIRLQPLNMSCRLLYFYPNKFFLFFFLINALFLWGYFVGTKNIFTRYLFHALLVMFLSM
jgi:hypothetical protein